MANNSLTIDHFLAVIEMIAAQLRIKAEDRWSTAICLLKFTSFQSEFPEVSAEQLLWSAEQWIQATAGKSFLKFPTWRELLAHLYRSENGLANRSWGFRDGLPPFVQPTAAQLAMLPALPSSIAVLPQGEHDPATYQAAPRAHRPMLMPAASKGPGLTAEKWQEFLRSRPVEANGNTD